jgi:hypothetical protein
MIMAHGICATWLLTPLFGVLQFLQRMSTIGDRYGTAGMHVLWDEAVAIVLQR